MDFRIGFSSILLASALATHAVAHGGMRVVPLEEYAGSEVCRSCHLGKYSEWRSTLHFSVVQDPKVSPTAVLGDFSQPGIGFGPEDVEFTVGGHWSQRYVQRIGGRLYALPKVWSVASHAWEEQDRWSWTKKPYDEYCIGCHTTGYDPGTGTYAERSVGCEACHGPGRNHAESAGKVAILNPSHLSPEEQDLICASCHVRGRDPTGTYSFPVGYVPGARLEEFYSPLRLADDESPRSGFVRLYREWRERLESGEPPSCDVCGITRPTQKPLKESSQADCQACHRFGDRYPSHTNHPRRVDLQCLDCHAKVDLPVWTPADVHAPEYFRVHRKTAYASSVVPGCRTCHAGDGVVPERALERWDHTRHLPE